jgi:ABC-type transport system, involved in lipoprotein release, permease component
MWITLFFLLNIYLGIYIVFSGRVKKRFQEVGLRMAIGSTRIGVVGLIAGESLMLLLLSSIPVLIAAINFAYFGLLNASFEVSSLRVILEFALTELILSVAVIASVIIPALRASKTNPAEVLHYE